MTDVTEPELLTEISQDGLARVTINRPHRLNTLSRSLMKDLRRTFVELADNRSVRVILLSAAGDDTFCAGADMKEPGRHEYDSLGAYLETQPSVYDAMRRCPQVIVSAVNGWAVGGGMQLALFSDLVYASEGAKFKLPQVRLGIMAPYGTGIRLARTIGNARAMQMLLLGTTMTAAEGLACGFVQGVSPDAKALRTDVEDVLQSLLHAPVESLLLTKSSVLHGWDTSADGAAEADRFRDYALKRSPAMKEIHEDWMATRD